MLPTNRPPTTPGEMLLEEFLKPAGITQAAFAQRIGMSPQQLNPIVRGKHAVSARVALLFGQALDTSPEFWMNLQARVDLWEAEKLLGKVAKVASLFRRPPRSRPTNVAAKATGPRVRRAGSPMPRSTSR